MLYSPNNPKILTWMEKMELVGDRPPNWYKKDLMVWYMDKDEFCSGVQDFGLFARVLTRFSVPLSHRSNGMMPKKYFEEHTYPMLLSQINYAKKHGFYGCFISYEWLGGNIPKRMQRNLKEKNIKSFLLDGTYETAPNSLQRILYIPFYDNVEFTI